MEMISIAAVAIVLMNLSWGVILWLRVRKLYCYPGELGFPVIGNLFYFYKTLFLVTADRTVKLLARQSEKYGEHGIFFHFVHGQRIIAVITSPQIVKEIAFHPDLADKPDFLYGGFNGLMQGVFTYSRSDNLWKQRRKEYNICLRRSLIDNNYLKIFHKSGNKIVDMMLTSSAVDAHHHASAAILTTNVETLFGLQTSSVDHPEVIKTINLISDFGSFMFANPNIARTVLTFLSPLEALFFKKTIDMRKEAVELAMSKMDEITLTEQPLSVQIVSRCMKQDGNRKIMLMELQELYLVSLHTLTSTLADMIVLLAVLPEIQERAWKEQYEIFANDDRDPTMEDIDQMAYLDRFIKESFRFVGPPYIAKLAAQDININGVIIPKGVGVVFLMGYMRKDPKYFKNPEEFDPDRFLEKNDALKYTHTPFGFGIRNCPGSYFATLLIKTILSKILRKLKLSPIQKDFRFQDIQYQWGLLSEIKNHPLLQVEERT